MKTCKHWQDIGNPQGGECTLHNRTQSFGVCRACLDNTSKDWPAANNMLQRAKIGTKIAKATNAIGIKPCGGCKKRAQILNGD
jgi:hypothetical protein